MIVRTSCLLAAIACLPAPVIQAADQPNIVHVFVDDLGWGALSMNDAYGHTSQILTPNLDQFAADGMRFTQAYSAGICSPSRGMIMTGQHAGHGHNDRNVRGFIAQDITVADVLSDAGYNTAMYGKWGFGGGSGTATTDGSGGWTAEERLNDLRINPSISGNSSVNLPTNQGFDEFYGYLNHTHAHFYYVDSFWESTDGSTYQRSFTGNGLRDNNGNLVDDVFGTPINLKTAYSDVLFQERAVQYIQDHANQSDPFYLQLNYNIPHTRYPGIEFVEGWDEPYQNHPEWDNWTDDQKQYVAMVTKMDQHFGELMSKLEDPDGNPLTNDGIAENTLVVFTSDNGSDAHPEAGQDQSAGALASNGALLGGKRDLYEGGIRVPMVVRWTGQIEGGAVNDTVTDFADWLPTAADAAGVEAPVGVDGVSILPTLTGEGVQRKRPWFVWENHEAKAGYGTVENFSTSHQNLWAIEKDGIKVIKTIRDNSTQIAYEIFDLTNDPIEQHPLAYDQAVIDLFQAIADAEQLEQAAGYYAYRRSWVGTGGNLLTASSWSSAGTPDQRWMADLDNTSNTAATVLLTTDVELLAIDVRGSGAQHTLAVLSGKTLTGRNEIRIADNGVIFLDNGNLSSVRWVDVLEGGLLTGEGNITGQLYNAGEVAPGNSPGRLTLDSDYIQLETGSLAIEIGGAAAGTDYDQLVVEGHAFLDGQLVVNLVNGYTPQAGERFAVLTYDDRTGSFSEIIGLDLGGGYRFMADYQANSLELVTILVGDTDGDSDIDDSDLGTAFANYTGPVASGKTAAQGDTDGDGDVDDSDLGTLFANYTGPIALASVPEPASFALLSLGGLALMRRRNR